MTRPPLRCYRWIRGSPLEGEPNYDFPVKLDPAIDRRTLPAFFDDLGNSIWTRVEVTGQCDHPEARQCRGRSVPDGEQPPKPDAVVAYCRNQFVVTSIRILGKPRSDTKQAVRRGPLLQRHAS